MDMHEASDEFIELIPKLLAYEREAEEWFFKLAYGRLMAWATQNFHIPESEREDFALEVIEKTLTRLDKFKPGKAKFTTWIFVIARNHAFDRTRKQSDGKDPLRGALQMEVLDWMEMDDTSAVAEANGNIARAYITVPALTAALATLSESDRRLTGLIYGTMLNAVEIGQEVGITPETVRKRKQRILAKLQNLLVNGAGSLGRDTKPIEQFTNLTKIETQINL